MRHGRCPGGGGGEGFTNLDNARKGGGAESKNPSFGQTSFCEWPLTGKRSRKKIPDEHLQMDLALGSTTVSQVESQKLLGVIVDQDLAYEDHIDSLCKQISKRLGLLKPSVRT